MTFRLKWSLDGFEAAARAPADAAAVAITAAVRAGGEGMKLEMRQAVTRAGLGVRLPNAIRSDYYPARGNSMGAAAVIAPRANAAAILLAFENGAVIRARGGGWLAIPSDNVPSIDAGGRPMTPAQVEVAFNGDLEFVPNPGGYPVLVMRVIRGRSGGARANTRRRRSQGREPVRLLMFTLIPVAVLGDRLDLKAIADKWARAMPDLIARAMPGE